MTIDVDALRSHAREVGEERLRSRRGRLQQLTPVELRAVEETVESIGEAVARCLLEAAAADAVVATALESLYPVGNEPGRG
jgi:hypothetical protein